MKILILMFAICSSFAQPQINTKLPAWPPRPGGPRSEYVDINGVQHSVNDGPINIQLESGRAFPPTGPRYTYIDSNGVQHAVNNFKPIVLNERPSDGKRFINDLVPGINNILGKLPLAGSITPGGAFPPTGPRYTYIDSNGVQHAVNNFKPIVLNERPSDGKRFINDLVPGVNNILGKLPLAGSITPGGARFSLGDASRRVPGGSSQLGSPQLDGKRFVGGLLPGVGNLLGKLPLTASVIPSGARFSLGDGSRQVDGKRFVGVLLPGVGNLLGNLPLTGSITPGGQRLNKNDQIIDYYVTMEPPTYKRLVYVDKQ